MPDAGGSSRRSAPAPDDLAFPYLKPDDLCIGWDEGTYGEIRDAAACTRGQAIAFFVAESGEDFTNVRCLVRHVLMWTRQDCWEGPGRDRAADDLRNDRGGEISYEEAYALTPELVPGWWRPDESIPCWSVCRGDHPRAVKVWMLEVKGDNRIPDAPRSPISDESSQNEHADF